MATWPLAALTLAGGMAGWLPPAGAVELSAWLGPPVGEYVAVHVGKLPYAAGRTWLFGALLGVGLGRVGSRYLIDPWDPLAWAALLSAGAPMLVAGVWASVSHRR